MGFELGSIVASMKLDISDLSTKLKMAESEIQATEARFSGFTDIGNRFSSVGKSLSLGVTLPVVGLGAAAVTTAMNFDAGMSQVQALVGGTTEEMAKMKAQAIELGAQTAFSASEAAAGMANLASAGFNAQQTMDAMPGMMDLAAASGTDLATAAEIAASALNGFGLQASESGRVADVFASAAAQTNAGITDMGEAMKYVAPVAHAMGISIEETSSAIGILSNAGIKGSQAGTTLRSSMLSLSKPTDDAQKAMNKMSFTAFDSEGKMKSLSGIVGGLQTSMAGMTDQQKASTLTTLFGKEAMSGMLALISAGPEKMDSLTDSFKNSKGAASEMAKTMQDNLKGSFEQLKGSLESLAISFGDTLAPTLRDMADGLGNLVDNFNKLDKGTKEAIVKFALVAAAVGPCVWILGGMISTVAKVGAGLEFVAGLFGLFSAEAVVAGGATVIAGEGTVIATAGVGGLAGAFGTCLVAAAPWLLAIGAIAGIGFLIHKSMTTEATPAVNLFADGFVSASGKVAKSSKDMAIDTEYSTVKISDATKQAVGSYMKMDTDIEKSLWNIKYNGGKITDDTKKDLVSKFTSMGTAITQAMDKSCVDQYQTMEKFFIKEDALTDKQKIATLAQIKKDNDDKKKTIQGYLDEINKITKTSIDKDGNITADGLQKIEDIRKKMADTAVKTMSASELEQKVIMDRLKDYSGRITNEQASEVIKNAETQRQKTVDEANKQYELTVQAINSMSDEAIKATGKTKQQLLDDAEAQRKGTVDKAEAMKKDTVDKILAMNKSIGESVDLTTGAMITAWGKFGTAVSSAIQTAMSWVTQWNNQNVDNKTGTLTLNEYKNALDASGYATGTTNAIPGYHWVGEKGPELLKFEGGEEVLTNDESMNMAQKALESVSDKSNLYSDNKNTIYEKTNNSTVNTSNVNNHNSVSVSFNVENLVNDRSMTIQAIAEELAFYTKQKMIGMGVS